MPCVSVPWLILPPWLEKSFSSLLSPAEIPLDSGITSSGFTFETVSLPRSHFRPSPVCWASTSLFTAHNALCTFFFILFSSVNCSYMFTFCFYSVWFYTLCARTLCGHLHIPTQYLAPSRRIKHLFYNELKGQSPGGEGMMRTHTWPSRCNT